MHKLAVILIGILSLLISVNAVAQANSDVDACRKAVVVYLDVSGSMDQKRNNVVSIKNGHKISLMQAMGELFEVLLCRDERIIGPNDYFELKGFYSKVASVVPQSNRFKEMRPEVLRKAVMLQKGRMSGAERSRFMKNSIQKTSFAEVLKDMDISGDRLLQEGGAYSQYIYILFTDGLDDSGLPGLEEYFKNCAFAGHRSRVKSKTKVLLVSLPDYRNVQQQEINVQDYFRDYLQAFVFHCGEYVNADLIGSTIREQIRPAIEVVDIETPAPHSTLDKINIPVLLANDSCSDQQLKTISWEILSHPSGDRSPVKFAGLEVLKDDFIIKAGGSDENFSRYVLSLNERIPEGPIDITVRAETANGVFGREKKVQRRLEPTILMRNTEVDFSRERDRFIIKTKLTSNSRSELELDSLRMNLFRVSGEKAIRDEVFTNRLAESNYRSVVLSPSDSSYSDYFFEVSLPVLSSGSYEGEIYAQTTSGAKGNSVAISKNLPAYAMIENVKLVPDRSGEEYQLELTVANRGELPVTVDGIRLIQAQQESAGKSGPLSGWNEITSELINIEPVQLTKGGSAVVSMQLAERRIRSGANTHLLIMAEDLKEHGVSPAYVYELSEKRKSSPLGKMLIVLLVLGGIFFVVKNFVLNN
ncbi:hypothetical protein [Maridesulfovibrio sp.]|uniref:hypothetical protein n=1 Tax=Maridesulfovibrio sp. TaxID=2795000 RepID=UPI0039F128B4